MTLREFLLENVAGDLEYHPRRALLYLALGIASMCFWIFSPSETRFTHVPLVFALGSLALLLKGAFLLRKSSEGLGLSDQEMSALSDTPKALPSIPAQAAQIIQDFGAGSLLLWPLLNFGKDIDNSWDNPPILRVFLTGAIIFFLGWLVRRYMPPSQSS